MKFKVFSLGCKVNSYENAALASILISKGNIEDNVSPDVVIINTCSVTATADQKSRQHIRKFINKYPNAIVCVMGCYAQGNYEYIDKEIQPTILVGTSHRNEIPDLIEEYLISKKRIVKIDPNPRTFEYEEMGITSYTDNVRAYLKIQDGCNNFCSYCLIPYRRGKMRSRDPKNVIKEAEFLVKQGYKEIILSGIHVGGYGQDLGNISFSDLVESILDVPGLHRLRISSIEESEIDDKLINLLKTRDNLVKHMHIPVQSGCDNTLKRMNRHYNADEFYKKIIKIKDEIPNIALSTDVIVGFPGETDDDFKECKNFIIKCGFNMLHVFPFSAREGTAAFKMPSQIDPSLKNNRAKELIELSEKLWNDYSLNFIGQTLEILVEQYDSVNQYNIGHTSNYLLVKYHCNHSEVGQLVNVKITKDMIQSE